MHSGRVKLMGAIVVIDPDRCQGHGNCLVECPDVFESDDNGYATVRSSSSDDPAVIAKVRRAASQCPESAISVRDSD
jgi:ferredoxin